MSVVAHGPSPPSPNLRSHPMKSIVQPPAASRQSGVGVRVGTHVPWATSVGARRPSAVTVGGSGRRAPPAAHDDGQHAGTAPLTAHDDGDRRPPRPPTTQRRSRGLRRQGAGEDLRSRRARPAVRSSTRAYAVGGTPATRQQSGKGDHGTRCTRLWRFVALDFDAARAGSGGRLAPRGPIPVAGDRLAHHRQRGGDQRFHSSLPLVRRPDRYASEGDDSGPASRSRACHDRCICSCHGTAPRPAPVSGLRRLAGGSLREGP
jgi:hypothetical protein